MKRKIKFRAYRKSTQTTHNVLAIDFENKSVLLSDGETEAMADVDLRQDTGLKDQHEREIYEGDILRVTSKDGESYVATVIWFGNEGYPAFDLAGIPAPWYYESNALSTIFESGVETCTVIGNIFENPELLKIEK